MNREQRRKALKKMSRQERKAFKKGYKDIFKKSADEMYTGLESAFEKRWAETGNDDETLNEGERSYDNDWSDETESF